MTVNNKRGKAGFSGSVPEIAALSPWYLVLYKPAGMHTAPLHPGEKNTLLAWAASLFPDVLEIRGRKNGEGGLLHRLDYETRGLVLAARTQDAFDRLQAEQEAGRIVKEYEALSERRETTPEGFPPPPFLSSALPGGNAVIESAFRPWGRGRKAVRPVFDGAGEIYRTEILFHGIEEDRGRRRDFFRIRIVKGFRHQIRCHLAWTGSPLLNDPLYGGKTEPSLKNEARPLALCASAISFTCPGTKEQVEYRSM